MSDVITEQMGPILLVTINRPESRNAVNGAVSRDLAGAMDRLDDDPALSVGVITGAGGTFSSGMDLRAFAAGEKIVVDGRGMGYTERGPEKPLIAAVEGTALAGGTELALAADLIVASRDAVFGVPEVRRGLVAAGGALLRLPRRIPHQIAMEMALTGEKIPAERAHALGLVNRLTEPGGALEGALRLAETIAANAPLAVRATKAIITRSQDWPAESAFAQQLELVVPVVRSRDAREGAVAFAEKRTPEWRGE